MKLNFVKYILTMFLTLSFLSTNLFAQELVGVVKLPDLLRVNCAVNKNTLNRRGWVERYALIYRVLDESGLETVASGLVAIPKSVQYNPNPLLYLHATVNSKSNVPSHDSFESRRVACKSLSNTSVLIAPDYYGLGYGSGYHPFMVTQPTIKASEEFFKIAKEFINNRGIQMSRKVILAGYSQGGHATLAMHKKIEESGRTDIQIIASYAMSGPPNLSDNMLNHLLFDEPNKDTSFFTSLVISNYMQFYQEQHDYPPYMSEYSKSHEHALNMERKEMTALLPSSPWDFLNPDFAYDLAYNQNHLLKQRLEENDIQPWSARAPIVFTYSSGDTTIPSSGIIKFYKEMQLYNSNVHILEMSPMMPHRINFLKSSKFLGDKVKLLSSYY